MSISEYELFKRLDAEFDDVNFSTYPVSKPTSEIMVSFPVEKIASIRKSVPTYDGYQEILERVIGIIINEKLDDMVEDSLVTKVRIFEDEISTMLSGRYDDVDE